MAKNSKNVKATDAKTADEPRLSGAGPTPPQPTPAEINPFELEGLVIRPSYKQATHMVHSALSIPVKDKAGPATFFMTHPDPAYAQELLALKWAEDGEETRGEWYIIHPNVAKTIEDDPALKAVKVYYCVSQTGHEFLVVVPVGDGGRNDVYASKHTVFEAARSRYLKMYWVSGSKQWAYTYAEEGDKGPDIPPNWTEEGYLSILKRGFKTAKQDRYINSNDHFVMKAMRGIRP
jgi:hypothetical protein